MGVPRGPVGGNPPDPGPGGTSDISLPPTGKSGDIYI